MTRWRAIVGWKGFYEVSEDGRVRSVDRTIFTAAGPKVFKGRELRAGCVEGNYPQVSLIRGGRDRTYMPVHIAVARAFRGPCPPGKEVCHKDGTRTNNHYKNLRYGTRKDNAADRKLHGRRHSPPPMFGEANPFAKLNDKKVRAIRKAKGQTLAQIGARYGVSGSTIYNVRVRKTWGHVK